MKFLYMTLVALTLSAEPTKPPEHNKSFVEAPRLKPLPKKEKSLLQICLQFSDQSLRFSQAQLKTLRRQLSRFMGIPLTDEVIAQIQQEVSLFYQTLGRPLTAIQAHIQEANNCILILELGKKLKEEK